MKQQNKTSFLPVFRNGIYIVHFKYVHLAVTIIIIECPTFKAALLQIELSSALLHGRMLPQSLSFMVSVSKT